MSASRSAQAPARRTEDAPAAGLLHRPEVRDALAWLRLLADPGDAAAVVRALTRPPIELRQADLARVIALARRRKLDLVLGLSLATESAQVPLQARERIQRFVELHRAAVQDMRSLAPDAFLDALIARLGERPRALISAGRAREEHAAREELRALAARFARANPGAGTGALADHLAAAAREPAAHAPGEGAAEDGVDTEAAEGRLEETLELLREEVLASVARIGGRLGELRLDTDLDICHGVVRYLELLKLSALVQRRGEEALNEAIADINARLLAATTPLQREIYETSTLDDALLAADGDPLARAHALAPRGEPSLGPFLPRRGLGLALSASDIQTYLSCPLRYKFARVLRIPVDSTLSQRFGIVVHQVLERYHSQEGEVGAGDASPGRLLELLDSCWRRAGLGEDEHATALYVKAREALRRYHARLRDEDALPVWFERQFDFRLGPHHVRGRIDRIDRRAGREDAYELIDYKTSRPRSAAELERDVQLSLYALAAREAWQLESASEAYYYVLDDVKVTVPRDDRDPSAVADTVLEVGEGILAQEFEPTPSHAACSLCDYRIVCPAAEV